MAKSGIGLIKREGNNLALYDPSSKNLKGLFLGTAQSVGVAKVDTNAKSGNPAHDVHSGKFGSTGPKKNTGVVPQNTQNPAAYRAMRDAVVDAAREAGIDTPEALANFLKGRTQRPPTEGELQQMLAQITSVRLDTLVDYYYGKLTGKGARATIQAPRKWAKEAINKASDTDLSQIIDRLVVKGYKQDSVRKLISKDMVDKTRRETFLGD